MNPILNRILNKIEINDNDCWIWRGAVIRKYGGITINKKLKKVHRVMFEIFYGDIPEGKQVCHHCDTPSCCNPEHLFTGTAQENMNDCVNKKRIAWGERNCKAKLTKEDVLNIRNDNRIHRKIANDYGVVTQTIQWIKSGGTWKYL